MIKSVNSSILAHLVDHNHSVDFQTSFRQIYTVNGRLSKPIRHRLLAIAEAIGIRVFKPVLCLMKNYVRTLGLQWPSHTQAITCAGMDHALSNPEYCPVQIWPLLGSGRPMSVVPCFYLHLIGSRMFFVIFHTVYSLMMCRWKRIRLLTCFLTWESL